jgi:hypothetical protein
MQSSSVGKKKAYLPPAVTKLTQEQAKQFVAGRAHCSGQEAEDLLESLLREQRRKEKEKKETSCAELG